MSDGSGPAGDHTDVYIAQQRAIVDLLHHCSGDSETTIMQLLGRVLAVRNLPVPPRPWLRAVADEISHDHLYVVASGLVANDYFSNPAGIRAADRVEMPRHDLEPPESSRERMAQGQAPGNQIA